ncbi:MAG: hypothetical protein HGA54_05550, partial [Actinobacteria bacterium]|nr:hypothetical protein [Actinomycetota bacterium]
RQPGFFVPMPGVPGFERAFQHLLDRDHYILEKGLNEQTIVHRFAMYLQGAYADLDVDCEWNKSLNGDKTVNFDPLVGTMKKGIIAVLNSSNRIPEYIRDDIKSKLNEGIEVGIKTLETLLSQLEDSDRMIIDDAERIVGIWLTKTSGENVLVRVRPDIVCHKRGTNDKNYLVIEAKRASKHDPVTKAYDIMKLWCYTDSMQCAYRHGVYIEFPDENPTTTVGKLMFNRVIIAGEKYKNIFDVSSK